MDPSNAEVLNTFSPSHAQTTPYPAINTQTQSTECLTLEILAGKPPKQAPTTYRKPSTLQTLKPTLTLLQELSFNTKNAPYTPLLVSRPENTLFARAYTPSLSCTVPRNRSTLPAGYLPSRLPLPVAGTRDPVTAWSRVRSAPQSF